VQSLDFVGPASGEISYGFCIAGNAIADTLLEVGVTMRSRWAIALAVFVWVLASPTRASTVVYSYTARVLDSGGTANNPPGLFPATPTTIFGTFSFDSNWLDVGGTYSGAATFSANISGHDLVNHAGIGIQPSPAPFIRIRTLSTAATTLDNNSSYRALMEIFLQSSIGFSDLANGPPDLSLLKRLNFELYISLLSDVLFDGACCRSSYLAGQLTSLSLVPPASVVPLPPSALLQVSALAFLGLLAWRRKRKGHCPPLPC
jgi:hypothetical protein